MKKILITFCASILFLNAIAQINSKRIKKDITYLSSDKLKGRFPGTKEELLAANYISKEFQKVGLQTKGTDGYFQAFSFSTSTNPHASEEQKTIKGIAHNVIGFLDNNSNYTVVIGGHYDHLGLGNAGNSLDPNPINKIHNGADDNASGTSGVMELARYFSTNGYKEKVNFLFICFSGEEEGLLGSKYFTNNPTLELGSISFMINMDMIGRLNDSTNRIILSGVGTSPQFPIALANVNSEIKYKADSAGMGPSDHASFYLKNIPVLHFYTGTHMDYHKPSDDVDKINMVGEEKVLNFVAALILELSGNPNKLAFTQTKNNSSASSASFKVTLGVIPDYAFDGIGLRLDGVTEGKSASLAGLKTGDIILKMNDFTIKDIQDYMKGLGMFTKGQTIQLSILRAGKELSLPVTF